MKRADYAFSVQVHHSYEISCIIAFELDYLKHRGTSVIFFACDRRTPSYFSWTVRCIVGISRGLRMYLRRTKIYQVRCFQISVQSHQAYTKMASSKQKRTLTIALLIADTPVPQVLAKRGDYSQIYSEWLEKSQKAIARHDWQDDYEIHLLPFDVVTEQKYPDEGIMHDGLIDAVMVTGSGRLHEIVYDVE